MSGGSNALRAVAIAAGIVVVGGLLLQRTSPAARKDPVASVDNGAPRGWLLLRLLLDNGADNDADNGADNDAGSDVDVIRDVKDEARLFAHADGVVFEPPPERSAWSSAEAEALLRFADNGGRVVVVCDPQKARRNRLGAVLARLQVTCFERDEAESPTLATSTLPGVPSPLLLRDRGRLKVADSASALPLLVSGDAAAPDVVAVVFVVGKGDVVVVGSGTVFANDGLTEEHAAGFLRWLVGGRHVVVDERHHRTRGSAVIGRAALQGPGPLTGFVALLLLIPLSLLAFAPRKGEFNDDDVDLDDAPAAAVRVRALAALLFEDEHKE